MGIPQLKMLPPLRTINPVLHDSKLAREYLLANDIFNKPICKTGNCRRYNVKMTNHSLYQYRCPGCRTSASIRTGFFKNSKLPLHTMLQLFYSLLNGTINKSLRAMNIAGPVAIGEYYRFIREVIEDDLINNPVQIGGPGVIVEIDETKRGKRKYHRGHRVEGRNEQW